MLVLTRKLQETIQIGDNVTLTVLKVKGNTVRIGIEAPKEVRVIRGELPPKERTTFQIDLPISDEGDTEADADSWRKQMPLGNLLPQQVASVA